MGGNKGRGSLPFYTLTVHLIKGKDLVIKDKNGKKDRN